MSYILDALRKADAERRGVPAPTGLAEPAVLVAPNDPDPDLPPATARPWAWVLGGMALALAGFAAWHLLLRDRGEPAAVAVAAAPMPPPAPAPVPAPPPPAPAPPPAPSADALPNFPPPLPDPPKPAPPPPAPAPVAAPAAARTSPPPGIAVVPAAPAPAAAPAEKVFALAELPEAVRRDFPRLSVGGAMYSERPADRMVVLNGQVFHEGDTLGKDLRLRQIKLKSAVFDFRSYRVEVGY